MTEQASESATFRIIVHAAPAVDVGVTHWTEAPECPIAHDDGQSADEAVERTKQRVLAWWSRRHPAPGEATVRFVVEQAY